MYLQNKEPGHKMAIDLPLLLNHSFAGILYRYLKDDIIVMIPSFRMDRSGQTVQTQIRLLLEEPSLFAGGLQLKPGESNSLSQPVCSPTVPCSYPYSS